MGLGDFRLVAGAKDRPADQTYSGEAFAAGLVPWGARAGRTAWDTECLAQSVIIYASDAGLPAGSGR